MIVFFHPLFPYEICTSCCCHSSDMKQQNKCSRKCAIQKIRVCMWNKKQFTGNCTRSTMLRSNKHSSWSPPRTHKTCAAKISAGVNGGLSEGSSVRRPGSADPHRRQRKYCIISVSFSFSNVSLGSSLTLLWPLIYTYLRAYKLWSSPLARVPCEDSSV